MFILIIDDSENDIELMKLAINASGIVAEYDTAMSKKEILAVLKQNKYDIMICDYDLRDTNALEVLSFYKQAGLDVPFICTSGIVTEQSLVDLVKAGAHGFFLKKDLRLLPDIIRKERQEFMQRLEQREADENLKLVNSLKSRGEMLGRSAEEFSRMFNVVIGNLHIAQSHSLPDACAQAISLSQEAANKALKIALNMLISSGKTIKPTDSVNLLEFLADNSYYFKLLVPSSINFSMELPESLFMIMGDKIMLRHAIGAIIANAVEAIHDSANRSNSVTIRLSSDDKNVSICIEDTGCGISPEILNQIFDPFFSTKIKSCGLGLTSAFGVVSAHNGRIQIESAVNVGTKIFIYLPKINIPEESR